MPRRPKGNKADNGYQPAANRKLVTPKGRKIDIRAEERKANRAIRNYTGR